MQRRVEADGATSTDRFAAMDALFAPRSVAILGASAKRSASGNEALANLLAAGFPAERIGIVHPLATTIDGLPAVPSIRDLPERPEVALLSLPGAALAEAVRELDAIGCRAAVVPTAGLSDGETRALDAAVSASSMVVHGPNCMGLLSVADAVPLWFYEGLLTDLPSGPVSLVSQSGSATFLTKAVQGPGFARVVSTGNELDLGVADYLRWLALDPATEVVGLVIEQVADVPAFATAVAELRDRGKPVVALKVGRTEAGQRATAAHTGALVSPHDAIAGFFGRLGVPLVADYDELAVALEVLSAPRLRQVAGPRIAVLTDSGGEAALAADLAAERGIKLASFSHATRAALSRLVPGVPIGNPFDVGASPATSGDDYVEAYRIAAADPEVDSVLVLLEAHGSLSEPEVRYVVEMLGDAVHAAAAEKPLVVASSSSASVHPLVSTLLGGAVPVVRGIANGLVALAAAGSRSPAAGPGPRPAGLPDAAAVALLRRSLAGLSGPLPPALLDGVLRAYDVPAVASLVTEDVEEAVAWAADRYPVVVKVSSEAIPHRSDVGGVVLDVSGADALRAAMDRIRASVRPSHPLLDVRRFEIQEQVGDAFEAMVGIAAGTPFGPSVVLGSGGTLVELRGDTATHPAPLAAARAAELVGQLQLGALLRGYRNLHPVTDATAFTELVARVGWMAHDLDGLIEAADFNPVLIEPGSGRVRVADALVVAAGAANHRPHTEASAAGVAR